MGTIAYARGKDSQWLALRRLIVYLHRALRGDKRETRTKTPTAQREKREFIWHGVVAAAKSETNSNNLCRISSLVEIKVGFF